MAEIISQYGQWLLIFAYLVANEIILHNPAIVSGSIPSLLWNMLKGAVIGKPTPPTLSLNMWQAILAWIAEKILIYLLGKAYGAAIDAAKDLEQDKARGEVNDQNLKIYEEAKTRKDRIDAALKLLNRDPR